MLAKMTSKNQVTPPKTVISEITASEYFDVEVEDGRIVLTPVRLQRADAVRKKLSALGIQDADITDARAWARRQK